jgi:arylsulfatase A-like enzyme
MAERPPNIVVTVADDQQAGAIGALGSQVVTPTLDAMMAGGTAFTRAYHFGSAHPAVCAPSRAMLHTGRSYFNLPRALHDPYLLEAGGVDAADLEAAAALPMLGGLLAQRGYRTFATGKWHNGPLPFHRSFQGGANLFFGGMCDHDRVPLHRFDPTGAYPDDDRRVGRGFSTDLFADAAVDFVERSDDDRPFFLYLAFTAPHDPRTPLPRYSDLYPRDDVEVPPNFLPRHPFDIGDSFSVRDERLAPWPRTEGVVRQHLGDYYGMVTHMDDAVGRVRAALEARGALGDTLFVHTGDHGLAVGQHGLLGKQNLYEHSVAVPLVLTGPGVPEGRRSDALVYQHDLFPTLLEAAGVVPPPRGEFASLWPHIVGEGARRRRSIFSSYDDRQRMVRDERYKLITTFGAGDGGADRRQLFDLAEDPHETVDLIDDPAQIAHLERLQLSLEGWMRGSNDPLMGARA